MKGISLVHRVGGRLAALTVCSALGFASAASAATFNVNDTRDLPQSGTATPGTCVSTASTCTLRAAVQAANESGGPSMINLPSGTYSITDTTSNGSSTCSGVADQSIGDFKVNPCDNSTQVTILGAGSGSSVINAGGSGYRLFDLYPNGSLELQKLTLENGDGASTDPYSKGSSPYLPDGDGGAIVSDGHLSLESVTFTGNTVSTGDEAGGAIAAEDLPGSTLSATADVFQNNSAFEGGAVFTNAPDDASIAFSLFQANSVTGANSFAGALFAGNGAAELTLNFDDFTQNVASGPDSFAGGVEWVGHGALNITDSLFNQNQAVGGDAGAIENDTDVNVNIANTSFNGNTSPVGGAMLDAGSTALNLSQDRFSGNVASISGGALYLESGNHPVITVASTEFDGNSASNEGGGIYWASAPLTLTGDSFVLNTAAYGGALGQESSGLFTMIDSTMSRNTASNAGGGIYADDQAPATITNDTIAFNNAPSGSGGGIDSPNNFLSGGTPNTGFGIENTTIAENSGGDCGSPSFTKTPIPPGTTPFDVGNNNDSDQSCFGGLGGPGDLVGVNPLLSNPANNGGPAAGGPGDTETVQTDAEQSNSPLIDAGNNSGCPSVDERGVSRPQGAACDIGAFEFGASPTSTSTTTAAVTTTTSKSTTVTSTSTTHKPPHKHKKCKKGHHRSHGRCVKNKKHKKHHKRKRRK